MIQHKDFQIHQQMWIQISEGHFNALLRIEQDLLIGICKIQAAIININKISLNKEQVV